jgi:hypothetical protein
MEFPVSLTVLIERDPAETLSRLGSRLGIDNRVGIRVKKSSMKSIGYVEPCDRRLVVGPPTYQ